MDDHVTWCQLPFIYININLWCGNTDRFIIGKTSPAKPIFKSIISGADIFAADSDIESTPKMKKGPALQEKIFNIPNID